MKRMSPMVGNRITVQCNRKEEHVVFADGARLHQVVHVVLVNAFKYTRKVSERTRNKPCPRRVLVSAFQGHAQSQGACLATSSGSTRALGWWLAVLSALGRSGQALCRTLDCLPAHHTRSAGFCVMHHQSHKGSGCVARQHAREGVGAADPCTNKPLVPGADARAAHEA